jgi:uncharacterized membrane protein HdeD (DUF308 family)
MLTQQLWVFERAHRPTTTTLAAFAARALILGRAVWSAMFALSLLATTQGQSFDLFTKLGHFLAVDGMILALATVAAIVAVPELEVWPIAATDAITRMALGYIMQANPGIPGFPVTAVAYLAFVGILFLFDGVSEVVIAIRWRDALGRRVAHVFLLTGGVVLAFIAIPIAAATTEDALRSCLVLVACLQTLLFGTGAFEHVRRRIRPVR